MRFTMLTLGLLLAGNVALAQPTPQAVEDATREQRAAQREYLREQGQYRDNRYPYWCQMYDRRDYRREVRACGDDYRCRRYANRKAERCGLR